MATPVGSERAPLIERRSIDYIPESERHGKLYSQFTLWMGANLQITAIVTGALAVVLGGDVFWSLVGLLVGQLFGGAIMALHAAQGPRLGLPQMIPAGCSSASTARRFPSRWSASCTWASPPPAPCCPARPSASCWA